MKKTIAILLAAAAFAVTQAAAEMKDAVMIQQEGALWTETDSGEMKWAKNVPAGTLLSVSDEKPFTAKRPSGSKTVESDFLHAEYDGKPYAVMADRIAFGDEDELKAIRQDAVLYSSANVLDYTATVVPQHKAVIIGEQKQANGIMFTAVTWFDDVKYIKRSGWVRQDKILSGKDDWAALELIAKAKRAKDKKVQSAIIADARTLSISSDIEKQLDIAEYNFLMDFSPDDTEAHDLSSVLNLGNPGAYVLIYDCPGTRGNVIGLLFHGSRIHSDKRTKGKTTEAVSRFGESMTLPDRWYHIEGSISEDGTTDWPSGWVFNAAAGLEQ
ncbi:MAG: hypothetical protein IJU95_06750 [Treponema sp.]|nr:hypothetical protein [Treponema sp.]